MPVFHVLTVWGVVDADRYTVYTVVDADRDTVNTVVDADRDTVNTVVFKTSNNQCCSF